jgi:hypothetical protein
VYASGNVSLGDRIVSAGLPLAGQRVTLRLDGPVVHILSAAGSDTYQITIEPGITVTAARTASRDIRRHEASNYDQHPAPEGSLTARATGWRL